MTAELKLLPKQELDNILHYQDVRDPMEQLRLVDNMGDFFDGANDIATKFYFQNPVNLFSRRRDENQLGVDLEKVERAVKYHDFKGTEPDSGDPYNKLLQAVSYKEQIARAIIRGILESGENNLGLTNTEKLVLLANCELGFQFDNLYMQFNRAIYNSPVEKIAREVSNVTGKETATKTFQNLGMINRKRDYMYALFISDEKSVKPVAYAELFAEPMGNISSVIDGLNHKLAIDGSPEALQMRDYFQTLKYALGEKDVGRHEELWTKVEEAWVRLKGRIQPVHMMESYGDPLGLRIDPDFSLQFVDTRYTDIKRGIDETKKRLIGWLQKNYSDHQSVVKSLNPMRKSTGNAYTQAISGKRLDFRVSGQNIPNRGPIKYENGSKVFVDVRTRLLRWPTILDTVAKVFGEEQMKQYFYENPDNYDPEIIYASMKTQTAGHEFSHSALEGPDTREKLGPYLYNELWEIKSNIIPSAAINDIADETDKPAFIKALLATSFRALSWRENETQRPYYNSAVVIINLMLEAGIIRYDGNTWTMDISTDTINAFQKGSEGMFRELLGIYDSESPEAGNRFMEKFVKEGEKTELMAKLLDKLEVKIG